MKWVSVKERLPSDNDTYFVYSMADYGEAGIEKYVREAHYDNWGDERTGWRVFDLYGDPVRFEHVWDEETITHWWTSPVTRNMPEPPTEEE